MSVKIGIILGTHIAATAPGLVADCKIIDIPGFFAAVFLSEFRHGGYTVESHVFNPFAHFSYGTASHVTVDICLATELTTEFHELVRTEAVVFNNSAPVGIDHLFSACLIADSVHPVVFVGKTSAGPS